MSDRFEVIVSGLRAWTRDHDAHVRAAVELLIWHETWLRRSDFVTKCVKRDRAQWWISWQDAREFSDETRRASTSELAILDLAVALGEDRYRLGIMGAAHSRAIASAAAAACGLGEFDPGGGRG